MRAILALMAVSVLCCAPSIGVMNKLAPPSLERLEDRRLAVNYNQACAVSSGALFCWGSRMSSPGPADFPWHSGPISSRAVDYLAPYRVHLPASPRSIVLSSEGMITGCVLLHGGDLFCFGDNLSGAETCIRHPSHVFVRRPLPAPVTQVTALGGEACALLLDDRVLCWGRISDPRYEEDATPRGCSPRVVSLPSGEPLRDIVRLAVGAAIDRKGALFVWTGEEQLVARRVQGIGRSVALAATESTVCVVLEDGLVRCFDAGDDEPGDLTPIVGLPAVDQLRCASTHNCVAHGTDGHVYAWGNHTSFFGRETQLERGPLSDATELALGGQGGCMLRDGVVLCWGEARAGVVPLRVPTGPVEIPLPQP